jgi:osmotically-inducible protein OsmY
VDEGWVTLRGELDWAYQSAAAEKAVRPLVGVRGVTNEIRLKQGANPQDIRNDILAALKRHAEREAKHIDVEVEAGVVTLRGLVDSLVHRDAAIGTAMSSKGVTRVVDRLDVAA